MEEDEVYSKQTAVNELEHEGVEVDEFVARSLSLPFIINKAPRVHEARNELLIGSGRCRPSTVTAGVDGHALDEEHTLKKHQRASPVVQRAEELEVFRGLSCLDPCRRRAVRSAKAVPAIIPSSGIFGHDISLNRRALLFFWYAQVRVLLVFGCV